MNKQLESINEWILKRSKRQKIGLILLGFLLIYYIFHLFFTGPVVARQEVLEQKITELKSQEDAITQQFLMIQKIVESPEFKNLIIENQRLQLQGKQIKKTIASFTPVFVAESDFPKLTKDILSQIDKNIVLVSLKEFTDQAWDAPVIDKSVIIVKNINQHKIAIEFHANYFDTIAYLQRLEKLPWYLYWDNLQYKVIKYPEADVTIQLYVLSNKKSI